MTTATIKSFRWVQHQAFTLTLALGTLSAAVLVLYYHFFARGKDLLFVYAFLAIATGVILKTSRIESFAERFAVGLGSFMIATLAHYIYIVTIDNPSALLGIAVFGHAWRLGFMLLVGTILNLALARITK